MNQTVVISCLFVKCRASMAGLCAAGYPQTLYWTLKHHDYCCLEN
jgi:hypothetical protein